MASGAGAFEQRADASWKPTFGSPSVCSVETSTPPLPDGELGTRTASGTSTAVPSGSRQDSCDGGSLCGHRGSGGNLRRRKYHTPPAAIPEVAAAVSTGPISLERALTEVVPEARPKPDPAAEVAGRDDKVLIQGPLEQRTLLSLWWRRWCVLDQHELRVYKSEDSFLSEPYRPLSRLRSVSLDVVPDPSSPQVLVIQGLSAEGVQPLALRAGPRARWEEMVATQLWLAAFAAVS